jgi:hypothetical protein
VNKIDKRTLALDLAVWIELPEMGKPGRQFHVRLDERLSANLTEIEAHFCGLPRSTLMRLLISSVLDRPLDERIEAVQQQMRKKPGEPSKRRQAGAGLNSQKRFES